MPVVVFSGREIKETGQTLSIAALATFMSIKHNQKILLISTDFRQNILEDCFWKPREEIITETEYTSELKTNLDSGVEGLLKIVQSNRATPSIIKNYSKTVLRDRLDILSAPITKDREEYNRLMQSYTKIVQLANQYYDIVLVDLNKNVNSVDFESIINLADVFVITLNQRLRCIETMAKLREKNNFYRQNKIMILLGKYDKNSKYTVKNINRYLKEKSTIHILPYNILFAEYCSEGKILDYLLKLRNIKEDNGDPNKILVKEVEKLVEGILKKIKESQQMRKN